jgi:hypothetical protein
LPQARQIYEKAAVLTAETVDVQVGLTSGVPQSNGDNTYVRSIRDIPLKVTEVGWRRLESVNESLTRQSRKVERQVTNMCSNVEDDGVRIDEDGAGRHRFPLA